MDHDVTVNPHRVTLVMLLTAEDVNPTDPSTWCIGGIPLGAADHQLLTEVTPDEWDLAETISHLEVERLRDSLEQWQRQAIRRAND